MNVLIDTSAVLRVLLGQDNPVSCWGEWQRAYASEYWVGTHPYYS